MPENQKPDVFKINAEFARRFEIDRIESSLSRSAAALEREREERTESERKLDKQNSFTNRLAVVAIVCSIIQAISSVIALFV